MAIATAADRLVSERDWTRTVRDLAKATGWTRYHTRFSVGSQGGFPDEILIHKASRRLVVAELKREGSKPTAQQEQWLEVWRSVPCAEVFVWRPSDWPEVSRVLASAIG